MRMAMSFDDGSAAFDSIPLPKDLESRMILCLDIGGSMIKSAVATSPDDIRILDRHPTPLTDYMAFQAVLRDLLASLPARPDCLSISMTGVIDPDTGIITCVNIPCIDQHRLQSDLERAFAIPVFIANDADCFVLAEAGNGVGKGHDIVFGIILGSGVGGGLAVEGRLINARGGFAGEWGHGGIVAAFAGNPPAAIPAFSCSCGQSGCVNTIGGARGLERLHLHLHGEYRPSINIIDAWQAGDSKSLRTVEIYVELISAPLALAVNITGASIVPAGGGLANSLELLAEIDLSVRRRILKQYQRPLVVRAACDVEPGLIGAALMGLERSRHG
jgi:N-acetylglucosamine kinase